MRSFQDGQYDFLKFLLSCHPSSEKLRGFPTSPQGLAMLCLLPGSIPCSLFFKHKSFLFPDFPPVAPSGGKAFPLVPPTTSFFGSQQKCHLLRPSPFPQHTLYPISLLTPLRTLSSSVIFVFLHPRTCLLLFSPLDWRSRDCIHFPRHSQLPAVYDWHMVGTQ